VTAPRLSVSEAIFLVVIASLPVMRPTLLQVRTYTIPPADVLFIAAAVSALVDLVAGIKTLPRSPAIWWIGAYAAAVGLSAVLSVDWPLSRIKFAGNLYLFGLAALALLHVRSVDALKRAFVAWMAGTAITIAAAVAALALFAAGYRGPYAGNPFLSVHGSLPGGTYPRVMGLFLNPNMYCAYLVVSLALVVTAYRTAWLSRRAAMIAGAAIVCAGVLSLSPGFGGMLIVVAFAVHAAWRTTRPERARAAIVAASLGAACFVAAITASPEPGAGFSLHGLRPSSRMLTWAGAATVFPKHPWFGKGVGTDVVAIHYVNAEGEAETLTDAHNTWLSILVQCGVIGLAAFVALVVVALRASRGSGDDTTIDRVVWGLRTAFVAGFLYQTLSGSFENTRHVWMLIGLLLAACEIRAQRQASIGRAYPGAPAAR